MKYSDYREELHRGDKFSEPHCTVICRTPSKRAKSAAGLRSVLHQLPAHNSLCFVHATICYLLSKVGRWPLLLEGIYGEFCWLFRSRFTAGVILVILNQINVTNSKIHSPLHCHWFSVLVGNLRKHYAISMPWMDEFVQLQVDVA